MITILSMGTSLCAAAATIGLFMAAPYDSGSFTAFGIWASGPYLGFCLMALAVRRSPTRSQLVLTAAVLSSLVGLILFGNYLSPFIKAHLNGTEPPMNCAGPIAEFGIPILQWIVVAVIGFVALSLPRAPAASPE
jgi:hypothetical protein